MALFRRLLFAALCAGLLSGAVATLAHQFGTVPVILAAEGHEPTPAVGHEGHGHAAWEPAAGLERIFFTALADGLTGIGFALLLVSAYALRGGAMSPRRGLIWGAAGFVVFTLAPSLGLPFRLPGAAESPVFDRQVWWLATAVLTASGLALIAFRRRLPWIALAVMLIALPHVVGAPQPVAPGGTVPDDLTRRFVLIATATSLLFWLSLGATTGLFYRRIVQRA
ncbi:MAG: CbtA family protein [Rhodospirillales bacterium]|jgi:cobalt transporter subunit CbtA